MQRPQPHTTNPWKEKEGDKIVGDTKERADHANRTALALLLKPANPTPSNTRSLRLIQRDTEGHKASAILRSPTTKRRERVPMSNQSTTSNMRRHIRQRQCTAQRMHWVFLILNSMHNSAIDRRWARLQSKTPPARKPALLTTLSSSLRCESAAEQHTAEQYSKTGRTKLQKDLRRSDRS